MLSSCISLWTNFLVTPLVSGIFDDSILTKSLTGAAKLSSIKDSDGPSGQFSTQFTYAAYDYQWQNGTLPQFITPTYAILPVKLAGIPTVNETWTAETILFEADLSCENAIITPIKAQNSTATGLDLSSPLDSQQNCIIWDTGVDTWIGCSNTTKLVEDPSPERYDYVDFVTPWTSLTYQVGGNDSQITMYLWASARESPTDSNSTKSLLPLNRTAIFCKSSYSSEPATVVLTMPLGNIQNVRRTGTRTAFTRPAGFTHMINGDFRNYTNVPPQYKDSAGRTVGLGYRPELLPNVDTFLSRRLGPRPPNLDDKYPPKAHRSKSMVCLENVYTLSAYALCNQTTDSLVELLDPKVLAEMYQSELQLFFALVVALDLVDNEITVPATISREVHTMGFTVNSLWARGTQGGLAVVAIMMAILCALNHGRRCELDGEPNSLAAALQLLAVSPQLCSQVENAEFHTEMELQRVLVGSGSHYKLLQGQERGPTIEVICGADEKLTYRSEPWMGATLWTIRARTAVGLVMFFSLLEILVLVVYFIGYKNNGMGRINTVIYRGETRLTVRVYRISNVRRPQLISIQAPLLVHSDGHWHLRRADPRRCRLQLLYACALRKTPPP